MLLHELIEGALFALGGRDRILSVGTFTASYRDEPGSRVVTISRAAGGRVRVDRTSPGAPHTLLINGELGMEVRGDVYRELSSEEIAEVRREARLAPRNFLAHSEEFHLTLEAEPDGYRIYTPADFCFYVFDRQTLLCKRRFDIRSGETVEYSDYREVDGILTPFFEMITGEGHDRIERVYEWVRYNADLPDGLFDVVASEGRSE